MSDVEIYTSPLCGFCHSAKRLLDSKGAAYREIDVTATPGARAEMAARNPGARTVPQIFINGAPIGGCDDLYELEFEKKLDALLAQKA